MATYVPRLSSAGMVGNPCWYSSALNPYYPANGLPNCTCYAYGSKQEYQEKVQISYSVSS